MDYKIPHMLHELKLQKHTRNTIHNTRWLNTITNIVKYLSNLTTLMIATNKCYSVWISHLHQQHRSQ
jgi:hypothetical protein